MTTLTAFKYRARTLTGSEVKEGIIQGINIDDARRQLVRSRLIPEWVKPVEQQIRVRKSYRSKIRAVTLFARQFSTLIDAGIPLIQALEVAGDLTDDKGLKKAIEQVSVDVQSGMTLAEAMRLYPRAFPSIFVNMVQAGEQGGVLDTVLERLAVYLEKNQALAEKMRSAMVYPVIILLVAILSAATMLTFVVPTFEEMFASGGLTLPYPTQVLINISNFLQAQWIKLLGGGVAGFFLLRQFRETPAGREFFDSLALRLPILGDLVKKTAVARFTQSMASLLASGVNLIDALVASASTAGNVIVERAILTARQPIESGQGISGPLENTGIMPDLVPKMVRVGEQTGNLDEMFSKVARFYETEVETAADRLMKALEPMLITVVGVILGSMVVALYLPIFEALTSVGG